MTQANLAKRLAGAVLFALAACTPPPPSGQATTPEGASNAPALPPTWVVENFESPSGLSGGMWFEFDKNNLGTIANPNPFTLTPGGAPGSPGNAAHIWGQLGADRAPWTWVQLQIFLDQSKQPFDLGSYKSISFYAKGDGGRYWISLATQSVKNYDYFHYEFTAPADWQLIQVPLSELKQAGWGERVPAQFGDVTMIQISPAVHDQPFDLWVDDVTLSAQDVRLEPVAYDTAGWFAWTGIDPEKRRGTALDVRRLLDAPAGKHGALRRKGDQFVFTDGTATRFWGVNLVGSANFPTHAEADRLAELLAELGVNMTRHHHIDAAWATPNLFGNGPTTRKLDPQALDRFDYFVSALQKQGIYQFFDLLVHRKVTAADAVPDAEKLAAGFKIEGEFAPEVIALEEEFIDAFMGHKNLYTKRTYAQDPGVALLEVINEDSLFYIHPDGEFGLKSPHYKDELNRLFSAWLSKKVPGGRAALEKRWQGGGRGLDAAEDPARGNVDASMAFVGQSEAVLGPARARDTLAFLYDTELGYYRRIQARLTKLGYRGLVTGSNHWVAHPLDLLANAQLDFIDRHAYWAHPNGGWGYKTDITFSPGAMVKDPNLGVVGSLALRRVHGLPYSTSEWQTSAPNDYREEGVLLVGASAAFQDFSPLEFAFSHDAENRPDAPGALDNNFDLIHQPAMLGAWPGVSLLFHRRDVAPAKEVATLAVPPAEQYTPNATLSAPLGLAVVARTGIDFQGGKSAAELEALKAKFSQGTVLRSDTGELRHDVTQGRFSVDSPRTQAFAGFGAGARIELTNVVIEPRNAFSLVMVSALDDQPITSSKHLLVSALGNAVNTGMTLTPSRNALANPGTAPILVEPIVGKVTLRGLAAAGGKAQAYALDPNGKRASEVPLSGDGASLGLELTAEHKTLHYELVRP